MTKLQFVDTASHIAITIDKTQPHAPRQLAKQLFGFENPTRMQYLVLEDLMQTLGFLRCRHATRTAKRIRYWHAQHRPGHYQPDSNQPGKERADR